MSSHASEFDRRMMARALELAAQGRGRVEPNPMVGAVITVGEEVVGEGFHRMFGGPHAEVEALRAAGDRARGATLYVTLEPCCHFGKTPPCVDAIVEAHVARVVVAMQDPFHAVSGGGLAKLRDAGLDVLVGVRENEALALNAPYLKLTLSKVPFITAKWAMTLDGKIATPTGDSRWISCEQSRRRVHELRNVVDAVMIGLHTALRDDPLLTCRIPEGRNPRRIVVDSRARLPLTSKLVTSAAEAPVWIACGPRAPKSSVGKLESVGCRVLRVAGRNGRVDLRDLLRRLGEERLTHVLAEGGGRLFGSLFEERLVDRVMVFIAPRLVGGEHGPSPIGGPGVKLMSDAWRLEDARWRASGDDILVEGKVVYGPG